MVSIRQPARCGDHGGARLNTGLRQFAAPSSLSKNVSHGRAGPGDLVTHVTLGARGRDVTAPAARLLEINMRCQANIISALSSRLDLPASVSSSPRLVSCSGVLVISVLRGARVTSISDMRYRAALRKVQTDDAASVLRFGRCGQGRGLHRPWSPPVLTM